MRGCAERAARRAWKLSRPESAQNKKKKATARARLQAAAGDFHIAVNPAALNSDLAAFVSLTAPALSTAGVLLDGALPPSAPPLIHTPHPSPRAWQTPTTTTTTTKSPTTTTTTTRRTSRLTRPRARQADAVRTTGLVAQVV